MKLVEDLQMVVVVNAAHVLSSVMAIVVVTVIIAINVAHLLHATLTILKLVVVVHVAHIIPNLGNSVVTAVQHHDHVLSPRALMPTVVATATSIATSVAHRSAANQDKLAQKVAVTSVAEKDPIPLKVAIDLEASVADQEQEPLANSVVAVAKHVLKVKETALSQEVLSLATVQLAATTVVVRVACGIKNNLKTTQLKASLFEKSLLAGCFYRLLKERRI